MSICRIVIGILTVFQLVVQSVNRHVYMESAAIHRRLTIKKLQPAAPHEQHLIVIAVKQKNIDQLTEILHDISNPDSTNYGKHWTKAEVVRLTQNKEGRDAIVEDLEKNGIKVEDETLRGEYIIASGTVERLESYLNCKFHVFDIPDVDSEDGEVKNDHVLALSKKRGGGGSEGGRRRKQVVRTEAYSVPAGIHEHVATILNTVQIAPWWKNKVVSVDEISREGREDVVGEVIEGEEREGERAKKRSGSGSVRGLAVSSTPSPQPTLSPSRAPYVSGEVSPPFLKNYYNISVSGISPSEALVSHGVLELGSDYLNPDDLTTFQKRYNLPIQGLAGYNDHVSSLACTYYSECAESNLDVQYIMGVAPGIPTYYHYESSTKINDAFTNFVLAVSNIANPANVYSISWGGYEAAVTLATRDTFNTEAIKLGVMGTTLLVSSGDDGVANYLISSYGKSYCGYYPTFPATSPYVTAVGGTMGPEKGQVEVACQADQTSSVAITTGGGISNLYSVPAFQKTHITKYFDQVLGSTNQPKSSANSAYSVNGRGYPDISLVAHRYLIIMAGKARYVDGTSASAPVFAAMVSLVNQRRKAAGKSLMGWINPFLYRNASQFINDITVGENNCGRLNSSNLITCCNEGFHATSGWDPVTGLGSINFRKFSDVAFALSGTSSSPPPPSSSSSSLSTFFPFELTNLAIIIISIVGFVLVAVIIFLSYYSYLRWRSRPTSTKSTATQASSGDRKSRAIAVQVDFPKIDIGEDIEMVCYETVEPKACTDVRRSYRNGNRLNYQRY